MKTYKINDVTLSETELRKLIKENPELKEEKLTRWKPEYNEKYWYINEYGNIDCADYNDSRFDIFNWRSNNYFKTEEEAQKALKRQEAINTVTLAIEELSKGWVPDWEDYDEQVFYIYYNHEEHCFEADYGFVQDCLILPYMKSKKIADQIIKDYEEELKIIFEI